MALLFLIPHLLWKTFGRRAGLNLRRHVHAIKTQEDQDKGVDRFTSSLELYLNSSQNIPIGYTSTYLTVKLLYIINTISQFFLLNAFLSFPFTTHGMVGLRRLFASEHLFESPRFPRVTMCDFMTRHLGSNQHWYAIQCNLPINIYNDRIFATIWIWLIVLTILNTISLISWLISLTHRHRLASIKKYLSISADTTSANQGPSLPPSGFTNYLQRDGYLMFRIIAHNTDDVLAGRLIQSLYESYRRSPRNHWFLWYGKSVIER